MHKFFRRAYKLRKPLLNQTTVIEDVIVVGAMVAGLAIISSAVAGTDTTFSAATTTITNWSTGSLGKLAAVAGIASALVGLVMKFDWRLIAGAAGIGLTAATGPGIVSALATAVF
jgi:conjugal transfer pilus assembly protein TraA